VTLRNRLLLGLSGDERAAVLAKAELVPLAIGTIIQEADEIASHAWFPNSGLASIVAILSDGTMVEGAAVGFDGFVGASLVLGVESSSSRAIWQMAGEAYRIPANHFRLLMEKPAFTSLLDGAIHALLDQVIQTVGCNRAHYLSPRLARWLLLTHDRAEDDEFVLTQEFIATMLGAPRPRVTVAAQQLASAGLISYRRGKITILDRQGLEDASCECYSVIGALMTSEPAA
jgi:CRP-like cAMP-binding protein